MTDAPPEGVSKILITAENIEVSSAGEGADGGWKTVIAGPVTFDLVALTGVEGVLGEAELDPGKYGQLRLDVVEATITIHDEDKAATVPSGKLRFAGGFELVAGETTILTLDFDADKSVVLRGNRDPLLKPMVKLLVRQADSELSDAQEIAEADELSEIPDTPTPSEPSPSPSPAGFEVGPCITTRAALGSDGNSGHQTFQAASNPA